MLYIWTVLIQFQKHINSKLSFLEGAKLLITISGGLDSVALTHLCHQLKLNFSLAHCNFNLRGNESDADEDFVLQLAEDLDLEVFIESFDTEDYAKQNKLSIQLAARKLRYHWFEELAEQLHFDYILTAHHADDNLETFLINLSRGTGLEGLIGIPEVNNNIVRPLLPFSRTEIEQYATENHFKWREDSSNASTKYVRNKLRHDVIPVLKEMNPQLLQNFSKTQGFLKQSKNVAEMNVQIISDSIILNSDENEIIYNIPKLKAIENQGFVIYSLFRNYGFKAWKDIRNLLNAQSGKFVYSNSHRLLKDRNILVLTKLSSYDELVYKIEEPLEDIKIPSGKLNFEYVSTLNEFHESIIYVDKDLLKFPLLIRKWQEGDVFYPLGMTGKKKLSKYFKDEKMSLLDKENTWILTSNNEIVWVVNRRADNRFRVTESTKQILKIKFK
jgi:tRNA(Ile)-lysidine synthase